MFRSLASLAALCTAGVLVLQTPAAEPAVIRSAGSGPWSAATTWEGGKVPAAGARVLIREGHRVVYDVASDAVIRGINIAGTLSFDPGKDTRLNVGLIKIQPGEEYSEEGFDCDAHRTANDPGKPRPALEVGTPDRPVQTGKTALIRLTYVEGLAKESCPAIVCCGGRMDFHGAPMNRTWVKLARTAKAGASELLLAEAVSGWKPGDRVIVTAANSTRRFDRNKNDSTEERIVQSCTGEKIELQQPLEVDHLAEGEFRGEVANLSRNVVVESADPSGVRGHTMYHRDSAGSISYAEFRHLGKEGVLGRYSLHFHLVGDTMRGSYVIGASIWDSANRWLTIHGTNYLVVRDCVGYRSIGHGYYLEDGTEVFNVLDRNLGVQARRGKRLPKQALPFDQNDGAAFWWANSLNTFTRNVAVENGQYGYRFEATPSSAMKLTLPVQQPDGSKKTVDIRTLPFVRFEDNETHSERGLYGCNLGEGVNRVGPDASHPFVVRNLKIWDVHYGFRPQVPNLLVENLTIHRAAYGVYHPNYDNHVYRNVTISQTNTEPFNRGHDDLSVQYGTLAVDGLTFDGCRSGGMPLVQISDDNPTGKAETHFRNVKTAHWTDNSKAKSLANLGGGPRPKPKTEKGVPVYFHDWYGPGRHALVVSTRSGDFRADPERYKSDPPLTGDESRVAQVADVPFPNPLSPVDDLPPMTVITHVERIGANSTKPSSPKAAYRIRGTTSDNGIVAKVVVNGIEAKATAVNFAEWEIVLKDIGADTKISAHALDAAGNVEKRPHARSAR